MAGKPLAEVEITPSLVARLLAEQHPDLSGHALGAIEQGWDNAVVRVGTSWAVRIPRRGIGARLARNEQRWLPVLAPRLPVAVPVPIRLGRPSATFPWPWSVVPWFDGEPAARHPLEDRTGWASHLADVVTALRTPAPPQAPANPYRGGPLAARDAVVRRRLRGLDVAGQGRALRLWERLVSVPGWTGRPVWLHGDLHPANMVVSDGTLRAVIDFGDLTSGDPATDLATAWLTFDAAGRRAFQGRVQARRPADAATWQRARGWALVLATAMLTDSDDDPLIRAIGVHALAQTLDGSRALPQADALFPSDTRLPSDATAAGLTRARVHRARQPSSFRPRRHGTASELLSTNGAQWGRPERTTSERFQRPADNSDGQGLVPEVQARQV